MSNDDKPSVRGGPIIAVVVGLPLLLLVSYVGAYFGLSRFYDSAPPVRIFKANWQVDFFMPGLVIEKHYREKNMWTCGPSYSDSID